MTCNKRDALLVLLAIILFGLLLNQRAMGSIFDLGCPTFLSNMATQIKNGIYPANFLATPGVPANYHQGSLLLSAILMKFFDVNAETSFRMIVVGFGTIVFALICLFSSMRIGVGRALFLVFVCYFSASLNYSLHWPLDSRGAGWYDYISLFEYLCSTSWPITFMLLFVVFQFTGSSINIRNAALIGGLLLLPMFNATAFVMLFVTTMIMLILEWRIQVRSATANGGFNYEINNIISCIKQPNLYWIVAIIVTYFLPKFYTSAMIVGGDYNSAEVTLRFLSPHFTHEIKQLLELHPFFNYVTLLPALAQLRQKGLERRFAASIFIISFAFPFVFWIKSINDWDNFHKFVVLSSFFSIFVWLEYFKHTSREFLSRVFIVGGVLSLFLSIPSIYNQVASRFELAKFVSEPGIKSTDDGGLLRFLNEQKSRPMLWVYPPPKELCSTSLDDVIGNSNVAVAGFYYESFLLSHALEKQISEDFQWYDGDPRVLQNRYPNLVHFYISRKNDWPVLLAHMKLKNILIETLGDYGVFTIGKNITQQ
jgi:hypothetical protein